jgi:hypothetical protein
MLEFHGKTMLDLPPDFESMPSTAEKTNVRTKSEKSRMFRAYKDRTARVSLIVHKVLEHPNRQTIRDVLTYSDNIWDNRLTPFRECLIRLQRYVTPGLTYRTQ